LRKLATGGNESGSAQPADRTSGIEAGSGIQLFLKKEISLRQNRENFSFKVAQSLYSSHRVDPGSRLLLNLILEEPAISFEKILDLGCGYGPLGIVLGRLNQDALVHMVDRDSLAVDFALANARENGIAGASVYGSLAYDSVTDSGFDLVVSNIPGKVGETVLEDMLLGATHMLQPGGTFALVCVTPLEPFVRETLTSVGAEVVRHASRSDHEAFCFIFPEDTGVPNIWRNSGLEPYWRGEFEAELGGNEVEFAVAWGLPEFDSLSFDTRLLLNEIAAHSLAEVNRLVVVNPGQGYVPVVASRAYEPRVLELSGRDLLALRYSALNLEQNGFSADQTQVSHFSALQETGDEADLIIAMIADDQSPEELHYLAQSASARLSNRGSCIFAGGSTPITRLTKSIASIPGLQVRRRKRRKGVSVITAGWW
jgi:2-polyprenyl-3-methyl-5-hydroxy-6-metoxy-1,4-benzoquinol methylase